MSNITIVKGDLIELANAGNFDIIVHGCNCFCRMKSGVAKEIAKHFPNNVLCDLRTKEGDINKLGTYQVVEYKKIYIPYNHINPVLDIKTFDLKVINAYTQFHYGYDGKKYFSDDSFKKICRDLDREFSGKIIGMPWIGCGLGGSSKEEVLKILKDTMKNCYIVICEL